MFISYALQDKTCIGKRCSVRVGTWFEESNLTLQQILIFTYMWVNKFSKAKILLEMSMSAMNYVKLDKFNRRVCDEFVNDDSLSVVQVNVSDIYFNLKNIFLHL